RAVGRHDHPGPTRSIDAADDGAEIARIRDLVEAREQRSLGGRELPAVGVAVRLTPRDHALVVTRTRGFAQLALELRVEARPIEVAQPRLGFERALGRPELEHLAPPAQRFPYRTPAVDLLADHFGTSW